MSAPHIHLLPETQRPATVEERRVRDLERGMDALKNRMFWLCILSAIYGATLAIVIGWLA
jgi:hypothetical protein